MTHSTLLSALLTASLFTAPVDTLVLSNGQRIAVKGEIAAGGGTAIFHRANGSLYSLPLQEIDLAATQRLADEVSLAEQNSRKQTATPTAQGLPPAPPRLRVTAQRKQRLLADLEKSRGTPGAINRPRPVPAPSTSATPAGVEVQVTRKDDEWFWRDQARALDEVVRQRKEELELLVEKEQRLNDNILGLLSLGYRSQQFSYQVFQLEQVRDQIVRGRLDVTRAERAYEQFRDDARRQGILPGWLH